MADFSGNTLGNRSNSDPFSGKRLEELDKSLQEIRIKHENELKALREKNIKELARMSKQAQEELNKTDLEFAKKVNEYRIALKNKYSEQYKQGLENLASIEKKIAKQVEDFIWNEKKKRAVSEKESKINAIKDEYATSMKYIEMKRKANLSSLQSEKKTRDKYRKEAKRLDKQEEKEKEKLAKKLRAAGATELEVTQATGKLSKEAVAEAVTSRETKSAIANNIINGLKAMFDSTIQTYGEYQTKVNARLQGSGNSWQGNGVLGALTVGAYSGGIESRIKNAIGVNPYVKLQKVMDNVVKATEAGIAYNIEQRSFLQSLSESIATTFDAFNSNLTRVIRLQQADSTAARLGLEAGLTSFFNEMYQDTAYLTDSFDVVSQNLIEATSQLTAEQAVELEYVAQKWLGSLYSVGFSSDAVNKISQALGYLGSGNVSALASNSEMQNLIVMAASRANMSYADMLLNGLDASSTNKLMQSMVEYLQEIAESDNKVVKSEYARVFGMSVSDLKAISNIQTVLPEISKSVMTYGGAMSELYSQMGELSSRVSIAGKLANLMENFKYTTATSIAANPVTYALWEITGMIEDLTGGINLPTISVMGNSVDLNTTVTNLMRAGIVGAGTLGGIGSIISGVGSSLNPASMLSKLGIANTAAASTLSRGSSLGSRSKKTGEKSSSTLVGNTAGGDYYQQTLMESEAESDKRIAQKKKESTDLTVNDIHEYLLRVFDPKMTEVEKLLAMIAGLSFSEKAFGERYTGKNNEEYRATTVKINYSNNIVDNSDTLNSIKNSVVDIADILKKVTTGDLALTTKTQSTTSIGIPGAGMTTINLGEGE